MAKRKVKTKGIEMPMEPERRLYVDLQDDELDLLDGLEIGEEIVLVVKGKVAGLSSRSSDYGDGVTKRGDIQLEDPDVEISTPGVFEKLSEDDD